MWNGAQWECLLVPGVCVYVLLLRSGMGQVCFLGKNYPCYCPASLLLPLHTKPSYPDTGKQVEGNNHQSLCVYWGLTASYTHTSTTSKKKKKKKWPATQSAECIFGGQSYFSRHVSVIIIPEVAHVWSQQAREQHSAHSAPRKMATQRWWRKQVLWLGLF